MDDEDTWVGPTPWSETDRAHAVMIADTDEWDDTDRDVEAQGSLVSTPQMFEDTGVVIIDKPAPAKSDHFDITFRQPEPRTRRATTADDWPPAPRQPAPQIHNRAVRRAAIFAIVARPES